MLKIRFKFYWYGYLYFEEKFKIRLIDYLMIFNKYWGYGM